MMEQVNSTMEHLQTKILLCDIPDVYKILQDRQRSPSIEKMYIKDDYDA